MDTTIHIAGVGVISAIGNNVAECLRSLETEQHGMAHMQYLDSVHKGVLPVAEVKLSNEELSTLSGLVAGKSRTAMLSVIAAREALADAAIPNITALRVGFISANTVGGMDKTEHFFPGYLANKNTGKLRNVIDHECGSITELVADTLGIKGYTSTISTACSSSANTIMFGARLIKNGMADVVVAGGVDALTKFTLNGFNTLMILDKEYCRPFDESRTGLNLGEGAGYVVLVSDKAAATMKNAPWCRLSGYCNANDAFHQTASSPDGIGSFMAMKGALERAGLQPEDISYINLHGTGTQNNDSSEGAAIQRLFGESLPKFSSTKSYTGHTLGASGGIEAVFSALALKHGIIYPSLRFQTPMAGFNHAPVTSFLRNEQVSHVLSNSFGFGGNCSSLILSKN